MIGNPEKRPRGRPKKECPDVAEESVRAVRKMAKNYEKFKLRAEAYPKMRPSLLRRMKVDTATLAENGRASYDHKKVQLISPGDRQFIEQYALAVESIFFLEQGIAAIKDERTRRIAEDTLMKGKSIESLRDDYGLCRRSLFWEKSMAIRWVAAFFEGYQSDAE